MTVKAVVVALVMTAAFVASTEGVADAKFSSAAAGTATSRSLAMPASTAPTASVAGRDVTVTWAAATLPGGTPVTGYVVRRYNTSGTLQTILANCSGTITATSCVEATSPIGTWRYTVQPQLGAWRSAESALSAAVTVTPSTPPAVQTVQMRDIDVDGRIDQLLVTFDDTLAPYTAGTAPWTLANVPSGGTLASVAVSGAIATLTIAEGAAAPNTAVGSFTVALAADPAGIRDADGHQSSFTARAPTDGAAPALTALSLLDTTSNGKVDRVTAVFSESLQTYSAGTAPWTLANVPSGGTLASVAVSGTTATLTLNQGAGAADTAVGSMTVAMASSATGIRDAAGNRGSFAAAAPVDLAKPVPLTVTDTNGTTNGRAQPGDTISITFSEALAAGSVPATTTVVLTDPSGAGNDTLTMAGVSNGARSTGAANYVTLDGGVASFAGSTVALSNANRTITVTIGATCSGTGCGSLGTQSSNGAYSFVAATTLTDAAGNVPVTTALSTNIRLF